MNILDEYWIEIGKNRRILDKTKDENCDKNLTKSGRKLKKIQKVD